MPERLSGHIPGGAGAAGNHGEVGDLFERKQFGFLLDFLWSRNAFIVLR